MHEPVKLHTLDEVVTGDGEEVGMPIWRVTSAGADKVSFGCGVRGSRRPVGADPGDSGRVSRQPVELGNLLTCQLSVVEAFGRALPLSRTYHARRSPPGMLALARAADGR
jgi:hypothetical protein